MEKRNNSELVKFIIVLTIMFPFFIFFEKHKYVVMNPIRLLIWFFLSNFIAIHFVIDIKKIWNFIYEKRYYIAAIFLVFVTVFKLHGSSVGMYENYIQPNFPVVESYPIFGNPLPIRSDEWAVSTPLLLTQAHESINFNEINTLLMASESMVTLFPKLPTFGFSAISYLFSWPYFFLSVERAFSLVWFGKIVFCFFAVFELLMILTNENKIASACGAVLIAFSPVILWWFSIEIVAFGCAAMVIFHKMLVTEKIKLKILYSCILAIFGLNYIFMMYPAWEVTYGYFFLCVVIFFVSKHKLKSIDILAITFTCLVIIISSIVIIGSAQNQLEIMTNTVYPGKRFITGGYGSEKLFHYPANLFFSFKDALNPSEFSQYMSFFPIPIIWGGFEIINNLKVKKKDMFLIMLVILSAVLSIWNFVEIPSIIVKMSLLSMSVPERSVVVVGFVSVILLIYLLSNYSLIEKRIKLRNVLVGISVTAIVVIVSSFTMNYLVSEYINKKMIFITFLVYFPLVFLILLRSTKYNKYFYILASIVSLFTGMKIHPISSGLDIMFRKPLALEVQNISKSDPDARWLVIRNDIATPNYIAANGAKTINTVNSVPNLDLWYKLDEDKTYENIYNRYAHVSVNLVDDNTNFELLSSDVIRLNLNYSQVCEIGAGYILSKENIENELENKISSEMIYNEDGQYIYRIDCVAR